MYTLNNVKAMPKVETKVEPTVEGRSVPKQAATPVETKLVATPIEPKSVVVNADNVRDTKELREVLVQTANTLVKGAVNIPYDNIYMALRGVARNQLNLGQVIEGDVPYKLAQGNSKGWRTQNGMLIIGKKETIEKKLESIIEPIVTILVMRKYKSSSESNMISSGVTYMICKKLGLDVRTYCLTEEYDRLVKNRTQIKPYINICGKVYKEIFETLGLTGALK